MQPIRNQQSSLPFSRVCALTFLLLPVCGHTQARSEEATSVGGKTGSGSLMNKPEGTVHRLPPASTKSVKPAAARPVAGRPAAAGPGHEPEAQTATILARANSEVNGSRFTLGEIAEIECKDKALLAQLRGIEIGSVSLPGMERMLGPGDITVHLRAAGLSRLLDTKRLEVVAPSEMRVLRSAHDVTAEEITQAAIASALIAIKDLPNASLESVGTGNKLTVPTGKIRIVAGAYRGLPESGTLVVPVNVLLDGKTMQTTEVTLRIRRKIMVAIARRTLEPHDIVNANDIVMSLVDLPAGFAKPIIDLDSAVGKRTLRRIVAEAPVSAAWLETLPDITPNTRLTIEYVLGSVRITAPGLARQAGMIGETIRVYAVDTHKELEATIIDDHTVRMTELE